MSEPTKLNLKCLDTLLSQLTKEDLDKFNKQQEERILSNMWMFMRNEFSEYKIIFTAATNDEAFNIASEFVEFRNCLRHSSEHIMTLISTEKVECVVCNYVDDSDKDPPHYHNIQEVTSKHWVTLLKFHVNHGSMILEKCSSLMRHKDNYMLYI